MRSLYTLLGEDPRRGAHAKCEGCIAWMRASVRGGKASCSHFPMPNVHLTATLQPLDELLIWKEILFGECATSRERCAPPFEHMLFNYDACLQPCHLTHGHPPMSATSTFVPLFCPQHVSTCFLDLGTC
jgi:hypothetical protein